MILAEKIWQNLDILRWPINLLPHISNKDHFWLSVRFRSIGARTPYTKVYKLFLSMGCSPNVSSYMTKLVTYKQCLPQGAPTSPTVLNLLLHVYDRKIFDYCSKRGVAVSRYVDDISISGSEKETKECLSYCIQEFSKIGLPVSRKKNVSYLSF